MAQSHPCDRSETLDPADRADHLALPHQMVDAAALHLGSLRDRPVWQAMPEAVQAGYGAAFPQDPMPLAEVWADLEASLLPHGIGNVHPRFFMWYMGAGTFTGALAEFLAAIDGSNLGAGYTAARQMDMQVTDWLRDMMGLAEPSMALMAPVGLNIVCFRHDPGGLDEAALRRLNSEVMLRLQEDGIAALSDTTVKGHHCLRMAICNHRTRREDLDLDLREGLRIAGEVLAEPAFL